MRYKHRKHRKNPRRAKRRHNPGLSSLAWVVNAGKRKKRRNPRKRRARARARRTSHARAMTVTRTVRINPRRRRRRNPSHHFMMRAHKRHHRKGHRKNPGFLGMVLAPIKANWFGALGTSFIDLFLMDPLASRLAPAVQGPAKMLGYPLLGALLGKFFKGPRGSKFAGQLAVFGFVFGVKDTIAQLLGTSQAQMKGLADAYTQRMAMMARQNRSLQPGMRYIPAANGYGMRYIPSPQMQGMRGMGYIPTPAAARTGAQMSGMGAGRRY